MMMVKLRVLLRIIKNDVGKDDANPVVVSHL